MSEVTVQQFPRPTVSVTKADRPRVEVAAAGPQGSSGPQGPAGATSMTALAHTNLSGQRAVVPRPDGSVEYADFTNSAHLNLPVWMTMTAVLAGNDVEVMAVGDWTEPSWAWTPGQPVFLGSNGQLTQVVPTTNFLLEVAQATAPTTLFWNPKVPIVLS